MIVRDVLSIAKEYLFYKNVKYVQKLKKIILWGTAISSKNRSDLFILHIKEQ